MGSDFFQQTPPIATFAVLGKDCLAASPLGREEGTAGKNSFPPTLPFCPSPLNLGAEISFLILNLFYKKGSFLV